MTMALPFDSKAKKMREAIAALESAVASKRSDEQDAQGRLKDTLNDAAKELRRLPVAGALVWKGRRDA